MSDVGMIDYQEAFRPDGVTPGERDCGHRWDLLAPFLPRGGILLDAGSNLGYFAIRAALERPDLAVLSLESDEDIAKKQAAMLRSHALQRVLLLHGRLSRGMTSQWASTCDWVDVTLLLAILHWVDDPAGVLSDLSSMSGRIIIELPDVADAGACGQAWLREWADPVDWVRRITGRSCRLVGRCERHTSSVPSHLIVVDGPVSRRPSHPYWGHDFRHPGGNKYELAFDGGRMQLRIRGRIVDYQPGLNLLNLTRLGRLCWPPQQSLRDAAFKAVSSWPGHLDPLPHNMLWTSQGIALIDGDDQRGDTDAIEAHRIVQHLLRQWARNRTTTPAAYVPHVPWFLRRLRRWPRYLAGRYLPPGVQRRIKRWLGEE